MDTTLKGLIDANLPEAPSDGDLKASNCEIRIVDAGTGKIQVTPGASGNGVHYTLKPLAELFGAGTPSKHVDPQDRVFMALFMAIEEAIVGCYRADSSLTDADVAIALDLLNSDPAGNVVHNSVADFVQLRLRLLLSMEDYSRQEVRQAIRKISKSVARHTCLSGQWGYLEFIDKCMR